MTCTIHGITFNDSDIVNANDFIPDGEYNPHNVRPWLLHDHGFPVALAFASCLQDAIDEAADAGKLNRYRLDIMALSDYGDEEEGVSRLGNTGEPFDIESLQFVELDNPPFSFCALMNAAEQAGMNA